MNDNPKRGGSQSEGGSPLPLWEGAKPCLQCGFCCRTAVCPCSTTPETPLSPEIKLKTVTAMLLGILAEGINRDKFALSMHQGKRIAMDAGVSEAEWKTVLVDLNEMHRRRRRLERHPWGGLFMW